MIWLFEFFSTFYWPLLPLTLLGTLRRAKWRRAVSRYGPGGLLLETAQSLIGTNTYVFFVPLSGAWDGRSIARLLEQYDIEMWGWGFWDQELFFHVHRDDAHYAQRILHAAGVELLG